MNKLLVLMSLFLFPLSSHAIMNELSLDFSYDKQIYGVNRQNDSVSRTYAAGISSYVLNYTAIDLSISKTSDVTNENDRINVSTGIDLISQESRVETIVYGVGIKQMFAPRTAFLVPGLSIGYAKQMVKYQSSFVVEDTVTNNTATVTGNERKQTVDSVFGTFSLQLKLSERMSLKGSVKTLFPAFEFKEARNNIKYAAGLTWIF